MEGEELEAIVREVAGRCEVPGAAVGVWTGGRELAAFHGVTSVENPLAVDASTLFQAGSVGKTYTATAIMRLVDQGHLDLESPARRYVPELRLRDEKVAEAVTVAQLLDHTAGWEGDLFIDTGEGDDAIARYVERMADLEQISPPGAAFAYNNAALSLAGRVIEKVTGGTYEAAIVSLLLEPLGLRRSFLFCNDVMTRRFAVGHTPQPDGSLSVARPWAFPRGGAPSGAVVCTVGDLLAWGRFHLADGVTPDGTRLVSTERMRAMRSPRMDIRGSALGDRVGLGWFLRDLEGLEIVSHDGGTNGQLARLMLVPDRHWAIAIMANAAPGGLELIDEVSRWALRTDLRVTERDPEPAELSAAELEEYVGRYESIALGCSVTSSGGRLRVELFAGGEGQEGGGGEDVTSGLPPLTVALLSGPGDRYIVTDGPAKGVRGYFTRGKDGSVTGVHAGGRLLARRGLSDG